MKKLVAVIAALSVITLTLSGCTVYYDAPQETVRTEEPVLAEEKTVQEESPETVREESPETTREENPEPVREAARETDVQGSFRNIALFGVDSTQGVLKDKTRSDTIMIASIDQDAGTCRLVSVYRDTYLNLGNDQYGKCNAAYASGGPEQAVGMLNTNLDLDITDYVAVGFGALTTMVDALGGIDIDVDEAELPHLNSYQLTMSQELGVPYQEITQTGLLHLNGVQATAYCRIRYTAGDDFKRTVRQREVLGAIFEKLKTQDIFTLAGMMENVMGEVYSSLSAAEMMELISVLTDSGYEAEDLGGFPKEGLFTTGYVGAQSCVIPNNLTKNVVWLHQFLFNDDEYEPSARVRECSAKIAQITGVGSADNEFPIKEQDGAGRRQEESQPEQKEEPQPELQSEQKEGPQKVIRKEPQKVTQKETQKVPQAELKEELQKEESQAELKEESQEEPQAEPQEEPRQTEQDQPEEAAETSFVRFDEPKQAAVQDAYGAVRVRGQAASDAPVVGLMNGGDEIELIGYTTGSDGKIWYEFTMVNGQTGYLREDMVVLGDVSGTDQPVSSEAETSVTEETPEMPEETEPEPEAAEEQPELSVILESQYLEVGSTAGVVVLLGDEKALPDEEGLEIRSSDERVLKVSRTQDGCEAEGIAEGQAILSVTWNEQEVSYIVQVEDRSEEKKTELYNLGVAELSAGDPAAAAGYFEQAAEEGSSEALLKLGRLYMEGTGVPQDTVKALEYYNRAMSAGLAEAAAAMGSFYEYDNGESINNFQLAKSYYSSAVENGYEEASEMIRRVDRKISILEDSPSISTTDLQDRGDNQYFVQGNYGLALAYYEMAAVRGLDEALFSAGYMYDEGVGTGQDHDRAARYYEKAAELGNEEAMGKLADLYLYGKGVEKDQDRAVELFMMGARNGDWFSQIRLGEIYEKGEDGVEQNYAKAIEYYTIAMKNGSVSAAKGLARIADIYRYGDGVDRDVKKAFDLYRSAGEGGSAYAAFSAGEIYETGSDVLNLAPDDKMAAQYYGIAASVSPESGSDASAQAQYRLGIMYEQGRGVPRDTSMAKMNYSKAAAQGYEPAVEALKRFN